MTENYELFLACLVTIKYTAYIDQPKFR